MYIIGSIEILRKLVKGGRIRRDGVAHIGFMLAQIPMAFSNIIFSVLFLKHRHFLSAFAAVLDFIVNVFILAVLKPFSRQTEFNLSERVRITLATFMVWQWVGYCIVRLILLLFWYIRNKKRIKQGVQLIRHEIPPLSSKEVNYQTIRAQ